MMTTTNNNDNGDEKEIIYRMAKSSKQSNESLKQQKMTTTTITTEAAVATVAVAKNKKQKQNITRATQIFIVHHHCDSFQIFLRIISMIMTVSVWSNVECVFVQFNRMPILKVRVVLLTLYVRASVCFCVIE